MQTDTDQAWMCPVKTFPDLFPRAVTQEVLRQLQRWLEMGKSWDFRKRQPSSSRKNSHRRKSRKVRAQMSLFLIFLLLFVTFVLFSCVSVFGVEYSPALICQWVCFTFVTFPKYITRAVHPQHRPQLVSKSWPEPWHWYLFTACHTDVIHLYFLSRHSALSHLLFVHTTLTAAGSCSSESAWFRF